MTLLGKDNKQLVHKGRGISALKSYYKPCFNDKQAALVLIAVFFHKLLTNVNCPDSNRKINLEISNTVQEM